LRGADEDTARCDVTDDHIEFTNWLATTSRPEEMDVHVHEDNMTG
jgi:hypothetical protein